MKANLLGDIRAENDLLMLDKAFYETVDYKTLLESADRCVIVGRRGTGKSALVYRLTEQWKNEKRTFIVNIAPEEDQIIGLRSIISLFGDTYLHVKAGAKLAWKYAMYMELACHINKHYKLKSQISHRTLTKHLKEWCDSRGSITSKLRKKLKTAINNDDPQEERIANLSDNLGIEDIEHSLLNVIKDSGYRFIVLIDRLDEGYSPDDFGVAIAGGFVQSVIDLNSKKVDGIDALIFLRDNMYRSISIRDPDFTRNIEGQVLRIHWDDYGLFNLICNRLRAAFNDTQENNTRLWNKYAANELNGRDGFRLALRLTLYRPRDILVLLNNAYLHAANQQRTTIVLSDIEDSAKTISNNRLIDLHKEYESIFPALGMFTAAFTSGPTEISAAQAAVAIDPILSKDDHDIGIQKDLAIFEDYKQVLQRLYSIGFIGTYDDSTGSFVFSHDGRDPNKEITGESVLLIHPCYWLALNLSKSTLDVEEADEIYDEYDIEISSITEEQRKKRIGKIIEEIKSIKHGHADSYAFEAWCLGAIKLIFAGDLSNIEIHPNKNGLQQRDIVGTNMDRTSTWSRILRDYNTRQVIFEVKNYSELKATDYRQINSYLAGTYGKLAFIICRDGDNNLISGKGLNWAQELFFGHKKIVVKLSEKYLVKHLSKIRNPQKHDAANIELNKLLDTYVRRYLIVKCK